MTMRYLLLVLAVGCTTTDPTAMKQVVEDELAAEVAPCSASTSSGQWCTETVTGVSSLLLSVWAINANDVFAVGENGTILRRINGAWTVMSSGVTNTLHAVWAASSTDVWAAGSGPGGSGGIVLRYNGTAWSRFAPCQRSAHIDAMWGSSATDVWFIGAGDVSHWDGTACKVVKSFGGILGAVSGTGPRDVWVAGESMSLTHFNGTSWQSINPAAPTADPKSWSTVLAIGPSNVWVTGSMSRKEAWHLTGNTWAAFDTRTVTSAGRLTGLFSSLSARASNDVWGVGGTKIGHWDGSAWTTMQPLSNTVSLHSVTTAAGRAWTVGNAGLIARIAF
jgi:hypothetical protein